jgi:hypothetical protein
MMEAGRAVVLICLLVLGSGTLLFSAGADAIPGKPGPQTENLQPSTGSTAADPETYINEKITAEQAEETAAASALTSELEISPPALTEPQETEPQLSIPCLHGLREDALLDDDSEEDPCGARPDSRTRFSVRFGSRIRTHNSMLGELDGLRVDYRLSRGLTLNGVAGYPVSSSKDKFNAARQMYGISAVTDKFARAWDLNSYLVEQQKDREVTSRSVGGAVRYLRPRRSALVFVDYDIFEDSLSSFMTSGAWKLPYRITLSATLDLRNGPLHKHQKKYLQKTMAGKEGWNWLLPDKRIKHFTKNRSNEVATVAFGLSHALSRRISLSGDVAMMDISGAATARGSAKSAERLSEYFYHLRLSGKDMVLAGDKNVLDLRHRITPSSRVSSASFDTKYAINRLWKISPQLRADYRSNTPENSVQWVTAPAVKMEYRWRKRYGVDIKAGGEWSTREDPDGNETRSSYFVSLGYKAQF